MNKTLFILFNLLGLTIFAQDKTLQSAAKFPIGAAVASALLAKNPVYRNVVEKQFNSLTTENALKWPAVHPAANSFDFRQGDVIVNYALAHHKRVHGHCLAWHRDLPNWLNNFEGDSVAWENLLKTHIATVVSHYKGKITSWDVVNEAITDGGKFRNNGGKAGETSIWVQHLGTDYIARAFIYAHQADPNALLFYNDYGQEYSPAKLKAILNMVADFKRRGIPINGLGLQMHININTPKTGIINALSQYAATGLLVHIAELDICVNPKNDKAISYTDSLQTAQANMYSFVATQYKTLVPAAQQYGITCWNMSDADSWITLWLKKNDWPLLFDKNYQPKRCFITFYNALITNN